MLLTVVIARHGAVAAWSRQVVLLHAKSLLTQELPLSPLPAAAKKQYAAATEQR
jgi:hypothetical protein